MTDLLNDLATPSDAELISSVRGGDVAAYGDLFARHRDAANRLARQLVRGPDADDLVSEAFAKVLSVLQGGGGPDVAFRAYLLTAVRRLHVDKMRAGAKVQTSDDMESFDPGVPFHDTAIANFESGAAAKAFATLPERWQLVLWHLEVEGNKPADIAPLLGMSANSVSALAYRAREGLRQAFLTMHLNDISDTDCRWVNEHLGAYVRKGLSNRDSTKVQAHLDQCRRCTAMYLELTEVNSNLAAIIAPLLLGAAGTAYLASTTGTAVGSFGITTIVGRVRDVVTANAGAATVGGVAASVVAATTVAAMVLPSTPEKVIAADQPATDSIPSAPVEATTRLPEPQQQDRDAQAPAEAPVAPDTPDTVVPVALPGADPTSPDPTPTDTPTPTDEPTPSDEPSPTEDPTPSEDPTPTDEPSPTAEPTPTGQPAPSTPSPTGPTPSSPAPTTPVPDPTVTPTPPVESVAFAAAPTYADGTVSFGLASGPVPASVRVDLSALPGGITFAPSGTDCTFIAGTSVVCPTGTGTSFALPLVVPTNQADTTVTLKLSADGVPDAFDTFTYDGVADVGLTALAPANPLPGTDGQYHVTTTLTGVTGLPYVDLTASGATVMGADGCTEVDGVLRCENPTDGQAVGLVLVAPTDVTTPITLTVSAPADYDEFAGTDNTVGTTLQPAPVVTETAYTAGPMATRTSGNTYTVTATVTVPAGATSVDFVLPSTQQEYVSASAGCTIDLVTKTMTCPVPDGTTSVSVSFAAKLPAGRGALVVRAGGEQVSAPIGLQP